VCPPNRTRPGSATAFEPANRAEASAGAGWLDLLDLLAGADVDLLARHGRWYLANREVRWLRRNALIALGNVGRPDDAEVVATVARYLGHADPMLRAHAAWAAGRLGCQDLLDLVADDPEPEVQTEVAMARCP
jgi:epoxyqueuosine reductase